MKSKAQILQSIRALSLPLVTLIDEPSKAGPYTRTRRSMMVEKLRSIGTAVVLFDDLAEVNDYVNNEIKERDKCINAAPALSHYNVNEWLHTNALDWERIKTFIVKGHLGVAESGAIWLGEKELQIRLFPFVCEHLLILLREEDLVFDLHEAYENIGDLEGGYGVFVAGPSKTADIEQSLVIGAHGPLQMTVLLLKGESGKTAPDQFPKPTGQGLP